MNKFLENLKPETIETLEKIIVEGGILKSLDELCDDNLEEAFVDGVIMNHEVSLVNAEEDGEKIDKEWLKQVSDAVTDFTTSKEWFAAIERLRKKGIYI